MALAIAIHRCIAVSHERSQVYIGTIGMEGAFEAMGEGTVDLNWAKEHHELWLEAEGAAAKPNSSLRQPTASPGE